MILSTIPARATPTRVLCVDDCSDTTAMMRVLLDSDPGMACVGCLGSADELLREVRRGPRPDVIVLDATMPGVSPFAAMTELAATFPEVRTIVYSAHDDAAFVDRAMDAGAWGCVSKDVGPEELLAAIRRVAAGEVVVPGRRSWAPVSGDGRAVA